MFIPPGDTIHESLATSYVHVDALVADLCEGGFSGFVEVVLRDTDSFIVIASGKVAAVVDKRGDPARSGETINYTRSTVEQIAERSRRERGRVSIYSYPATTADAVAGRVNAKVLYVGLSTEFTDLEKMINKLLRERDREWFIEINGEGLPGALIHMRDDTCRIITSTGDADSGALHLAGNPVLGRLIYECNRARGTFDVCFTQADAETVAEPQSIAPEQISASPSVNAIVAEAPAESNLARSQYAASEPLASKESPAGSVREAERPVLPELGEEQLESSGSAVSAAAAGQSNLAPQAEISTPGLTQDLIERRDADLSLVRGELPPASPDAEAMAETKRLMGEISRAIEGAAQAVGRPDSFSMSLRAGQIKIADRFPFLDPFAGEFEYLAGEIVFVGRATAEEFVEGLTEALKLAIGAVARSTAYADRFRSYVTEDLHTLLARERTEFEKFGLEQVIAQLLTVDRWRTDDR